MLSKLLILTIAGVFIGDLAVDWATFTVTEDLIWLCMVVLMIIVDKMNDNHKIQKDILSELSQIKVAVKKDG